jgi:hypothetical protein
MSHASVSVISSWTFLCNVADKVMMSELIHQVKSKQDIENSCADGIINMFAVYMTDILCMNCVQHVRSERFKYSFGHLMRNPC